MGKGFTAMFASMIDFSTVNKIMSFEDVSLKRRFTTEFTNMYFHPHSLVIQRWLPWVTLTSSSSENMHFKTELPENFMMSCLFLTSWLFSSDSGSFLLVRFFLMLGPVPCVGGGGKKRGLNEKFWSKEIWRIELRKYIADKIFWNPFQPFLLCECSWSH